jgi:hypothetical protein
VDGRRSCRQFPKLTAVEVGEIAASSDGSSVDRIVESQGQNFDVTYGLPAISFAGSARPLQTSLTTTLLPLHTAIRFEQTLSFVMVF